MTGTDGILQLIKDANTEEEFLLEADNEQTWHEILSAVEGDGRRYELENDIEFTELETSEIGVLLKLWEYLYTEPPEKRPQIA